MVCRTVAEGIAGITVFLLHG